MTRTLVAYSLRELTLSVAAMAMFAVMGLAANTTEFQQLTPDSAKKAKDEPALQRGVTAAEVRRLLGPPARISRQVLYRRSFEQWTYDDPRSMRLELDCVKGQEPRVLSIQKTKAKE